MIVEIVTFNDLRNLKPDKSSIVITVSKANNWMKGLSPFVLGPCKLYGDYVSKNMENAWQFSKTYEEFLDGDKIKDEYWIWAKYGWNDTIAHRYPMGKGRVPKFSYWDGERLGYIDARKKIYIPLYYNAVKDTEAFLYLQAVYDTHKKVDKDLYLVDFDAYRHRLYNMSYEDVINNQNKKCGHAFILGMMLEDKDTLTKYIGN